MAYCIYVIKYVISVLVTVQSMNSNFDPLFLDSCTNSNHKVIGQLFKKFFNSQLIIMINQ